MGKIFKQSDPVYFFETGAPEFNLTFGNFGDPKKNDISSFIRPYSSISLPSTSMFQVRSIQFCLDSWFWCPFLSDRGCFRPILMVEYQGLLNKVFM